MQPDGNHAPGRGASAAGPGRILERRWVVASKRHIEILGNFASFAMGGVSHPSQSYALELFGEDRVALARQAVPAFYRGQRAR